MSRLLQALSTLALAGLLTHCVTPSRGGEPAVPEGSVRLRFGWPEGFLTRVELTTLESRNGQPAEPKEVRYQLRLEGTGEERRLISEPVAAEEEGPPSITPSLLLGPGGELKRIEGVEQVVGQMGQEAESQGLPEEQKGQILELVRDALEQSSRHRWELLIGKWSGLTLKPGEAVERKSQMAVPLFGSQAGVQERVELKGSVPCKEGAAEQRCVRLVLEASLDPARLEEAKAALVRKVKSFMKANAGLPDAAIPEMEVVTLQLENTVEFIVEPETLVPHWQRSVGSSQMVFKDAEGEEQRFEIQGERVESFTPTR